MTGSRRISHFMASRWKARALIRRSAWMVKECTVSTSIASSPTRQPGPIFSLADGVPGKPGISRCAKIRYAASPARFFTIKLSPRRKYSFCYIEDICEVPPGQASKNGQRLKKPDRVAEHGDNLMFRADDSFQLTAKGYLWLILALNTTLRRYELLEFPVAMQRLHSAVQRFSGDKLVTTHLVIRQARRGMGRARFFGAAGRCAFQVYGW